MSAHVLDLRSAISEIRSAYDNLDHGQPFFFVVGAGLSAPSIPLAREIVDHCRQRASRPAEKAPAPPSASSLDTYSYWFDRAYPQPADRQRYLRSLIQGKPVSDASLRLAHILSSRRAANLVVTPNFDDFISRALTVFGISHTVSDHPDTVDRIDLASGEIKIVHVHGSYKFYDCRNLREEVERRALPSHRTTRTMAAFLDRALSFSSPLVIGYAGWEDDVIMSALRRRIEGASLPYRLYWFAYTNEDVLALEKQAPWLADHPDVRIVAPAVTGVGSGSDESTAVDASGTGAVLPAQVVFEQITRAFDLGEPEITQDPVGFFARQLRATLIQERGQSNLEGIYSFATVVERLERAAELEVADFRSRSAARESAGLDEVRRLVRRSKYAEAVTAAKPLVDKLRDTERRELYDLLLVALEDHDLDPEPRLLTSELLTRLADATAEIQNEPRFKSDQIRYLTAKGEALAQLKRFNDAIRVYDDVIAAAADETDEDVLRRRRYASTRKALALARLARHVDAVALYDSVLPELRRYPSEKWLVTQSEYNRAGFLSALGRVADAAQSYREFIDKNREAVDGWTQVLVAAALEALASIREDEGAVEEAIQTLAELYDLYGSTQHEQVGHVVGRAMLHFAELNARRGDTAGVASTLEQLDKLAERVPLPKSLLRSARRLRKVSVAAKAE